MNCRLLGLSIDGTYSHIAWLRIVYEGIKYKGRKQVEVKFPVIRDLTMEVAKAYGMLQHGASNTHAVRTGFIIDPDSVIRAILYYPVSCGRNTDQIKRLLAAIQMGDQFKVATPVNWQPGDDVIVPPPGSCGVAKERMASKDPNVRCLD